MHDFCSSNLLDLVVFCKKIVHYILKFRMFCPVIERKISLFNNLYDDRVRLNDKHNVFNIHVILIEQLVLFAIICLLYMIDWGQQFRRLNFCIFLH